MTPDEVGYIGIHLTFLLTIYIDLKIFKIKKLEDKV